MNVQCDICKEWLYGTTHKCPPLWHVWCPSQGGTESHALTYYARDNEEAAEKWAEASDSYGDYDIVKGKDIDVMVRQVTPVFGEVVKLNVSGESVPQYTAYVVEEK